MTYDPVAHRTAFAVWKDGAWHEETRLETDDGQRLVPYAASNNLLKHGVVLMPSRPEEYGTDADLVAEIQAFLQRVPRHGGGCHNGRGRDLATATREGRW